jgi:hypothetical protein
MRAGTRTKRIHLRDEILWNLPGQARKIIFPGKIRHVAVGTLQFRGLLLARRNP